MKRSNHKSTVTLVLPIYNEAESLPFLILELQKLLEKLKAQYEIDIIFVDDGSTDSTVSLLQEYQEILPLKVVAFTRNFGHQAALMAGLEEAEGDVVITLDSDLQHPPTLIPQMLAAYEAGNDIVFTKRQDDDSLGWFKKNSSNLFYKIMNLFAHIKVQEAGSDFRLMNRESLDALLSMPESRIFLRGMVSWIGFKTITLPFVSPARRKGESKYNLYKMVKLAVFGLVSFSTAPLYLSVVMGLMFSMATILYGVYVLYVRFWTGGAIAGWSSVIFMILGMGTILSFLLAIVGVYLAAIYDEVKQRPIYIRKSVSKQK